MDTYEFGYINFIDKTPELSNFFVYLWIFPIHWK
jgi:hypothetical protein